MSSSSSTVSELAPFVAAVLRDDVIHDLLEEINRLNLQVEQLQDNTVANAQRLTITNGGGEYFDEMMNEDEDDDNGVGGGGVAGENGQDDDPVITYATAQIDRDGEAERDIENVMWSVDMAMEPGVSCHYSQVHKLAMNLGGTSKSFIQRNVYRFGEVLAFHDYIDISHTLNVSLSVWEESELDVIATLHPISPLLAQQLRQRGDCWIGELRDIIDELVERDEERQNIALEFQQVKFNHQSLMRWHIPGTTLRW